MALHAEIEGLRKRGIRVDPRNLLISDRAHVVLPHHRSLDAQREDKFELGKPVSAEPRWRLLFVLSTLLSALVVGAFVSWRRKPPARSIAIFAVFAQLVATAYVQAAWLDGSGA